MFKHVVCVKYVFESIVNRRNTESLSSNTKRIQKKSNGTITLLRRK